MTLWTIKIYLDYYGCYKEFTTNEGIILFNYFSQLSRKN